MIKAEEYIQLKAFARQDGTFMGLLWIVSFALFLMSQSQPVLSVVFDISIVCIPFFAASRAKHFRDYALDGVISYHRAFAYLFLLFGYAILLFAIAQWVYFQFIDGGNLIAGMVKTINSQEFKVVIDAYKISKEELQKSMDQLTNATPVDFAVTFMWLNFIACILISSVLALFTMRTQKRPTN